MHLWLKAFHLVAMVAWFAALFYLFRLFAYQVERQHSPDSVALLKYAAERLYRVIANPAMMATWLFALTMVTLRPEFLTRPWLQVKISLVVGLTAYHVYVGRVRRRFAADDLFLTSRQCRLLNEIPTLFLIAIVLLAVLRPGG